MIEKIYSFILFFVGGIVGSIFYFIMVLLTDASFHIGDKLLTNNAEYSMMILSIFSFALIFSIAGPALKKRSKKATKIIGKDLEGIPAITIVASVIGLILGFLVALLISMTYRRLFSSLIYSIVTMCLYITCGYLGSIIATGISNRNNQIQGSRDGIFSQLFDNRRMDKIKSMEAPKILDTSAIIDGRIYQIMNTGFLTSPLIVPECVLSELRHIADSSDDLRRARGRRGLDVLAKIQDKYKIEIFPATKMKDLESILEVDVRLLKLAKQLKAKLITTDYNLNKVAIINDVQVLNINDLANAMRPVVIPGEEILIKIIKAGKDRAQGIGYLDDGTMVVVEEARNRIGEEVTVVITSILQTSAGKMIFGDIKKNNGK